MQRGKLRHREMRSCLAYPLKARSAQPHPTLAASCWGYVLPEAAFFCPCFRLGSGPFSGQRRTPTVEIEKEQQHCGQRPGLLRYFILLRLLDAAVCAPHVCGNAH